MRAITMESFESGVSLREIPTPEIAPNEVLVRVHAASINAIDAAVAAGALKGMMEHQFPVTIGKDLAGVVEAVGPDATRYAIGDEVLGCLVTPALHDGSFADYASLPEDGSVALKPATLDFVQAAALPLAGQTALIAVDALDVRDGDRVLMVGATGGVGSFAVQLAAKRGATVIATALPEDETYVRDLGATETIDYTDDVAAAIRARYPDGIERLLDLVNFADGFAPLADLIVPGGRAASSLNAADVEQLAARDVAATNVSGASDPEALGRLVDLTHSGAIRISIQRVFPLEEATDALDFFRNKHTRGKVAISVQT